MANLATTIYNINGNEKDINLIAMAFDGVDTIYQGLSQLDIDLDDSDDFMGEVLNSGKLSDGSYGIVTSTNWERCIELEEALYNQFEDITIYFQEEEFGCGIFRTNDPSFEIFSDKYYGDIDCEGEYFSNEKEMLDWFNDGLDTDFKTLDELNDYAEKMRETNQCYISYYECEAV